jgi:hypothetical protein
MEIWGRLVGFILERFASEMDYLERVIVIWVECWVEID